MSAGLSTAAIILEKKVLFKEHSMEFNAVSKFFQGLLVLFLIPFLDLDISGWMIFLIYGISLLAVLAIILETKAIRHSELSSVIPLSNISPALLLVFAYFLLGEKANFTQIFGIGILLVGAYVLQADHNWHDLKKPLTHFKSKYASYFLLSVFFSVFMGVGNKFVINNSVNILSLTFLYYIFTCLNFNAILFIKYDGLKNIKHGIKTEGFRIFLLGILFILARLSFLQAFTTAYIALVVAIKRLETLFSTVIGGELFHEKFVWQRSLACAIMLVGAYFIIIG